MFDNGEPTMDPAVLADMAVDPVVRKTRGNPVIGLRLRKDEVGGVDARARLEGVNRSQLIRRFLAYGMANMPAGWRP